MTYYTDEDTKVEHIMIDGNFTLCGLQKGWTRLDDMPTKEKWGTTCSGCQKELEELRTIRK